MELKPEDKGQNQLTTRAETRPARRTRKRGTATIDPTVVKVDATVQTPDVLSAQARDRANRQIVGAATAYTQAMQNGVPKLLDHMAQVDRLVADQLLGGVIEAHGGSEELVEDIILIED